MAVSVEVYEATFEPADADELDFDLADEPKRPARPYDPLEALGVPRDQWGRPLVLPDPAWGLTETTWPDGRTVRGQHADGRRPYTRISTACAWNDVAHGLATWKQRHSLLALARRPDAQARLAVLTYADGPMIDDIAAELLVRAADDGSDPGGELSAAARGTAWHGCTVPGAPRIDATHGPHLEPYAVTTEAFYGALERCGLELLEHEVFGVDHARGTAGTVDHLARVARSTRFSDRTGIEPGSVVMLDKKSGSLQWISFATQLALYARTRATDWRTGATRPWHADLDPERGIVASASLTSGEVKMYRVHTPSYLADSAVERYRLSLADHVKSLVSEGF